MQGVEESLYLSTRMAKGVELHREKRWLCVIFVQAHVFNSVWKGLRLAPRPLVCSVSNTFRQ